MKKLKEMSKKAKVLMLIGLFIVISIPIFALAASTPSATLEMASEVKRGDTVTVKLNLNIDEFAGAGFILNYDSDHFDFDPETGFTSTSSNSRSIATANEPQDGLIKIGVLVMPAGPDNLNTNNNGELATLKFKVKNNASGAYNFNLVLDELVKSEDGTVVDLDCKTKNTTTKVIVPATEFNLTNKNITIKNGDTAKVGYQILPEGVYPPLKPTFNVTAGDSVSVSEDGTIKALKNGDSTITATVKGFQAQTMNVKVINPIETITFDVGNLSMKRNEVKQINATAVPHRKDAEATGSTAITWSSSNERVASVDNGKVTAHTTGTAVIRAEVKVGQTVIAFKEITVNVIIPIENAEISDESLKLLIDSADPKKAQHTLSVKITPSDATNQEVTYESKNTNIATVNSKGLVTGVGAGKTTIIVKVNTYKTFEVPVEVIIPLKSLQLESKTVEMLPMQTKKLGLTINPNNTSEKSKIKWESSDPSIVRVDQDGNIEALKLGTVTITVKAENTEYEVKETKITVRVLKPVTSVVIIPSSEITMNKGDIETLGIKTYPEGDDVQKVTVTWTSQNTSIVKVDSKGVVTAVGTGTTTIIGKVSNGETVTAKITVINPIKDMSFTKKSTRIALNQTETLTLNINPSDYYYEPAKKIKWTSSDNRIASVDSKGVVTAKAKGTVTITAEIDGKKASITVEVYIPVSGIEINEAKEVNKEGVLEVEYGENYKLTATVLPKDTTESKEVTWSSSDPTAISVSKDGILTIHDTTKVVIITATASDNKTKASIKVKGKISITSFTVDASEMTIYKGSDNAKVISTKIGPNNTTESKEIKWTSDNPSIAIVDNNGKVTGLKAGVAIITGTLANGMKVSVKVTVEIIPLTDIEVEFQDEILKGKEGTIKIKPIPENSTELENIEYKSSDENILVVDKNGVIKALNEGSATITIKVGNVEKQIKVTVKGIHANGITAFVPKDKLKVGDQTSIQVKVDPEGYTEELTYTYETSNSKVVKVDKNGKISAVGVGSATITVKASNGMTSSFKITVTGAVVNPQTGLESFVFYLVVAITSLLGLGTAIYTKKRYTK